MKCCRPRSATVREDIGLETRGAAVSQTPPLRSASESRRRSKRPSPGLRDGSVIEMRSSKRFENKKGEGRLGGLQKETDSSPMAQLDGWFVRRQ